MKMDEIKAVLDLLEDTDVSEFEYEDENLRIGIKRGVVGAPMVAAVAAAAPAQGFAPAAGAAARMSARTAARDSSAV